MQVLCGTERLVALGRRCGLHLQCHATSADAATAAVVGSTVRAWLERWKTAGPSMQYTVAEVAGPEETFLAR